MGTSKFAVPALRALDDVSDHEIAAVVTQPDQPYGRGQKSHMSAVKSYAVKKGLQVLQPGSLRDEKSREEILKVDPKLAVVAAYGKILPSWVFNDLDHGAVNIHASLLPDYRGAAPIQRAIMSGEKETGITLIQMDEGLDTGDILNQKYIKIDGNETAGEIEEKLAKIASLLILEVIIEIKNNTLRSEIQPEVGSYAKKIEKTESRIEWKKDALAIHNKVRALNPHPGAYSYYQEKRLKIWSSLEESNDKKAIPGTITSLDNDDIWIECGKGTLVAKDVQPENKKRMTSRDFINGYRLKTGDRLE